MLANAASATTNATAESRPSHTILKQPFHGPNLPTHRPTNPQTHENVPVLSTRVPTVLLVDQDDAWREAVAAALKADYRVLRTSNGESALAMLMREDVDAMLIDVEQPGI